MNDATYNRFYREKRPQVLFTSEEGMETRVASDGEEWRKHKQYISEELTAVRKAVKDDANACGCFVGTALNSRVHGILDTAAHLLANGPADELSYEELAATVDEMQASHDRIRAKIEKLRKTRKAWPGFERDAYNLAIDDALDIVDYAGTD